MLVQRVAETNVRNFFYNFLHSSKYALSFSFLLLLVNVKYLASWRCSLASLERGN